MKFVRKDIQGLRALAVISVILYHAHLPIPGGFTGVDIFFVISGFVISLMLRRQTEKYTSKRLLANFYQRRFLRLTPALGVMVLFTVIASILILPPFGPQQNAGYTGLGAMLIIANLVIAITSGSYFDAPAESNPLLHTWSLSVEEQFYVVFPILLISSWLFAQRKPSKFPYAIVFVGIFTLVSFAITLLRPTLPDAFLWGFYSPLTRSWEFGAGALLALFVMKNPDTRIHFPRVFASVGLLLLTIGFWGISQNSNFPGVVTLIPVVGTLMLIYAGTSQSGKSKVTQFFELKPLVAVGDRSYSLYLWHWPFIVFFTVLYPDFPQIALLAAILSFIPALISYKFLETPLRKINTKPTKRFVSLLLVFVLVPAIVAAGVGWSASHFWLPKYTSGEMKVNHPGDIGQDIFLSELANYYPCEQKKLASQSGNGEGMTRCRQSQSGENVSVALVGDSHAEHLFPGFSKLLPGVNVINITRGEIPVKSASWQMSLIVDELVENQNIKIVIINDYWVVRGVPVKELAQTAKRLLTAGKQVFVLTDTPDFSFDAFICKFQRGLLLGPKCEENKKYFTDRAQDYLAKLQEVKALEPQIHLIDTTKYFCDSAKCSMLVRNQLMYRDIHHLNLPGSTYVATKLLEDPQFKAIVPSNY